MVSVWSLSLKFPKSDITEEDFNHELCAAAALNILVSGESFGLERSRSRSNSVGGV